MKNTPPEGLPKLPFPAILSTEEVIPFLLPRPTFCSCCRVVDASEQEPEAVRVEAATLEDLPDLTRLVMTLFEEEKDFEPDRERQEHGLRLILEQPNRGRIFVVRTEHHLIGMVNLLFTISTAEGGFVILMEDFIIHPDHRHRGYGEALMARVVEFSSKKDFRRITLLTDKISAESQRFFQKHGFVFSHMIPMRLVLDPSSSSQE